MSLSYPGFPEAGISKAYADGVSQLTSHWQAHLVIREIVNIVNSADTERLFGH